jgi:F-type H+-transporting ATPase subunit delta
MSTNKSFSTETSERYSRALYEVSKETGDLEKTEADVRNFTNLFESSSEIKNFIQNPTHVIETQNKAINILSEKLDFTKNLKNFLLLLIKKKRIFFVKKITNNFLKLCSKNRGEIKASLISSKELSSNELENIR